MCDARFLGKGWLPGMQKGRILIVDDDPLVRDVLAAIFFTHGQYVTERRERHGWNREGQSADYDMVFPTSTMPGITGIDFMRAAVSSPPSRWS
jgi:CheY-like chemotaxis protein